MVNNTIIDAAHETRVREWIKNDFYILKWPNLEIAGGAPREVFTSAESMKPGWRYGDPIKVTAEEIAFSHRETVFEFTGRYKVMYFGPWVAEATEAKAKHLCVKHGLPETSWDWEYDQDKRGCVKVRIYREIIKPFNVPA